MYKTSQRKGSRVFTRAHTHSASSLLGCLSVVWNYDVTCKVRPLTLLVDFPTKQFILSLNAWMLCRRYGVRFWLLFVWLSAYLLGERETRHDRFLPRCQHVLVSRPYWQYIFSEIDIILLNSLQTEVLRRHFISTQDITGAPGIVPSLTSDTHIHLIVIRRLKPLLITSACVLCSYVI